MARPYKDGDEEAILELARTVNPDRHYDHDQWMRWWKWMYVDNPFGKKYIWVCDDADKVVGHYAATKVLLKVMDKNVTGRRGVDKMTHPGYRRQGISRTMINCVRADLKKDNIFLNIGFGNAAARKAQDNPEVRDVGRFKIFAKPLNWKNSLMTKMDNCLLIMLGTACGRILDKTVYRLRKAPPIPDLMVSRVTSFDERINDFWNRMSNRYPIMVVRNQEYLNWRYVSVPDIEYTIYLAEKQGKIQGYVVLRTMTWEKVNLGVIFDLFFESKDIGQYLVATALEHCLSDNVDLVYARMIADVSYLKVYRANGFIKVPFAGTWFTTSIVPDIPGKFVTDPDNWFIQIGDSDFL